MTAPGKEKWKTYGNVFDGYTLRNLFKLSSQNHFSELKSPIFVGKESNVFSALTKDNSLVIVKIYRLENCDFNKMYDYIKYDPRYANLKKQRRKVIFSWTQREYRNLLKARSANVKVPMPIAFIDNILVLEFIGLGSPAPRLKDSVPNNLEEFSKKVFLYMKRLYSIGMTHGDLSEYNILNFNDSPVFIDFSQSTTKDSPIASDLLVRDVKNMVRFFNKNGLSLVEKEVLDYIKKQ